MKKYIYLIIVSIFSLHLNAQNSIKKVLVEKYYISDENDSTDITGGHLPMGSTTYRVFIQMKPGCKLQKIYGDNEHILMIASTDTFFNNIDRGKTFAKDINKTNYNNNTTALDTWLTIGQTTKTSGLTYFGIPKSQDTDGSFIGGINNDGGSDNIPMGLLNNDDPLAGIPLIMADGMDTMNSVPTSWSDFGFVNAISGVDSSIFGSIKKGTIFISNNAYIQNSGVSGVVSDSNQVLIAQLTTKGMLSFELNVEIIETDGTVVKYIASGIDTLNERFCPWLKYPITCGCMDPNYYEYSAENLCSIPDSCKTRIWSGCMDNKACNYDPNANFHIQSLCCYPGLCGNRDISKVCPHLTDETLKKMIIYPNPSENQITIETHQDVNQPGKVLIWDAYGKIKIEKELYVVSGLNKMEINTAELPKGLYLIHLYSGNDVMEQTFIKL